MEYKGLTSTEAKERLDKFGKNELASDKKENFFIKIIKILIEPMFLLLIIASVIYFILGEPRDGAIMLIFVLSIICIDIFQEWKTDKTLASLKELSAPRVRVLRDLEEIEISSAELVPDDIIFISEGTKIPADGIILSENDLMVNESTLTGEAEAVRKSTVCDSNDYWKTNKVYQGTLVVQGLATVKVEKTGVNTEYGKIGKAIAAVKPEKTPLQKQTDTLTKYSAIFAGVLFVLVTLLTFFRVNLNAEMKDRIISSILSGITLAMAMIPEEFPVILTVFLSMGAWRLAKKNALVRRLPSVETLGSVSVLCVDKTGTITENNMKLSEAVPYNTSLEHLALIMGSGCEIEAYDPMEKAMLEYAESIGITKEKVFEGELFKEYTFDNNTKIMGHIWFKNNKYILSAKGSPEGILKLCDISESERKNLHKEMDRLSEKGLRVIAVAENEFDNADSIPLNLCECTLKFLGLVGLYDPPRKSIENDIKVCHKAGIRVIMITGDNGSTAMAIAKQIGMDTSFGSTSGDEINKMTDAELKERVKHCNVFARVIPEHKSRIVKALQANGEIVAMTGDGVNDAAALKQANIGIAMGKRGSEVSREAADLILLDDNFSTIISTIKDGRRIYDNIRKAMGYVFAIHIPIAISSLLVPLLGIPTANALLAPLHVVLLELIIDPTCSVVLERQPLEGNAMNRPPRKVKDNILNPSTLIRSIIQGIAICLSSFLSYYLLLHNGYSVELSRTVAITTIVFANIFLVQTNSSSSELVIKSIPKLAKDKVMWIVHIVFLAALLIVLYTPINHVLALEALSAKWFFISLALGFGSVMWYEAVKAVKLIISRKK